VCVCVCVCARVHNVIMNVYLQSLWLLTHFNVAGLHEINEPNVFILI
jgi:hypothetical protein